MRIGLLAIVLCSAALGQDLYIDAGGSGTGMFVADRNFSGGLVNNDPTLGSGSWATQRYGASFRYSIPVVRGNYWVSVDVAAPNTVAVGQRLFTIAVNGVVSQPIDVFAAVGFKGKYTYRTKVVNAELVDIQFTGIKGNALANTIRLERVVPREVVELIPVSQMATNENKTQYTAALKYRPTPGTLMTVLEVDNANFPYTHDNFIVYQGAVSQEGSNNPTVIFNLNNYALSVNTKFRIIYSTEDQ